MILYSIQLRMIDGLTSFSFWHYDISYIFLVLVLIACLDYKGSVNSRLA